MESSPDKKPDLSPEQIRTLLSTDFKTSKPVKEPRRSARRRALWAAVILVAGLVYVILRFTTAPSKVIVVNTSGEDAASVVIESGNQRVDVGGLGNGEVRKVELMPGNPVHIQYTFDQRRVWTDSEPLAPFHSMTVFIGMDKKLRVVREAPWARVQAPPQLESPPTPRRKK